MSVCGTGSQDIGKRLSGNLLKFACEAMVDGAKAAEAEISAMMVTG